MTYPFSTTLGLTKNYSKPLILLLLIFILTVASCSKKRLPVSTGSNKIVVSKELHNFIKDGAELKLSTGRKKPNHVISAAMKYLGTPHCMGGITDKCLDCSGLTYLSFAQNNIKVPRKSQEQARYGQIILRPTDLRKGDLVFFTKSYKSSDYITHVGIYLGNNSFVHASTSKGVTITPLKNSWWAERFVFGTRVF